MAFTGQVLDNPISGERFVFHQTASDTGGQLLAFDLVLTPDGQVPGGHVHPVQEERFQVQRGRVKFRKGLRTVVAEPGEEVVVPPGSYHRFANAGAGLAVVRVEVRPALTMEQLYETAVALARDGRTMRTGMPKPLDLALFLRAFEPEVQAPLAPGLVRAATAPLAWLATRRGLERRYPRLSGATALGPVRPGDGRTASTRPEPSRPVAPARSRPPGHPKSARQRTSPRFCGSPSGSRQAGPSAVVSTRPPKERPWTPA